MNAWTIGRRLAGILIGGVATGLLFLIMVQGSFHKGITDFDFAHVLGTAVQGSAAEKRGGEALAVIGDSAGPTALYATLIASIVLLAFHSLVIVPLVRLHWAIQGVVLGVVAFLAIGFIFVPYADSRLDTPIGAWGAEGGAMTPVVLGLSALGACLLGARCYDLAASASWWEPREIVVDATLEQLGIEATSLELPEEGTEQGTMRPWG
jgi:hypothetical protein